VNAQQTLPRTTHTEVVDAAAPHFLQTVPRQFVHRASMAETLLTDCAPAGNDAFVLGAQWPRGHSFYEPVNHTHYDPLLIAETIRQAGLLLAHVGYDVPVGYCFISRDLGYRVSDPAALEIGGLPADVELRVECRDVRLRNMVLTSMEIAVSMFRDGSPVGTGHGSLSVVSKRAYERLRGGSRTPAPLPTAAPVPPARTGRDRARDVVLSETSRPDTWQLRVDVRHPVLFDHPLDHVPGMLLMEAMRQSAHLLTGPEILLPVGIESTYQSFTELDQPCLLSAVPLGLNPDGTQSVKAVLTQSDRTVSEGLVTLARLQPAV
jgi:hypothetical protein